MFEKVKEKLLRYCDYPADQLTEDTEIMTDLQIDSLVIMSIIGDYESELGISFDPDDVMDIVTVGDFVKALESKISNK